MEKVMYKVLLVDDEILTREAIGENTPWAEADFELIGTAANGKEAIDIIEDKMPNLVLTDICMPIMDGIQLAGYIHENHPEIKVIIISGYDEFEYAKQALRYEVSEYILKPITSIELLEELDKIKKKLDQANEQKVHFEKIQEEYQKSVPMLRNNFLNRLLEGSCPKSEIGNQMNRLGIQINGRAMAVVIVELDDASGFFQKYPDVDEGLVLFSISNIGGEIVEKSPEILHFQDPDSKSIFIFVEENEELLIHKIKNVGQEIMDAMWYFMKTKVCVVTGMTVETPLDWQISYENAKSAAESKFLLEDHQFIFGKDFSGKKEPGRIQTNLWVDKLVSLIKMNQKGELTQTIKQLFGEFRNSGIERKTILLYIQNMILSIRISLEELTSYGDGENQEADFINHLVDYKHLSEVERKCEEFCVACANDIAGKRESVNQKQAIKALEYMKQNYMNVNMSLNMVCAYLSVSTSYFSTIFKNYTGETFVESLTKIRMEKAKSLFETTNMKNYEVALEVGYSDPHYFSSTFKKHTGMTPSEYVKQLQ